MKPWKLYDIWRRIRSYNHGDAHRQGLVLRNTYEHRDGRIIPVHRWMLPEPGAGRKTFEVFGQLMTSDEIADAVAERMRRSYNKLGLEMDLFWNAIEKGVWDKRIWRDPAHFEQFAQKLQETGVQRGDMEKGAERILEFAPRLVYNVLEGNHGQAPYSSRLAARIHQLVFDWGNPADDFPHYSPSRQSIHISPYAAGLYHSGAVAKLYPFDSAPHIANPEMLFAHEFGHFFDHALSLTTFLTALKDLPGHPDPIFQGRYMPDYVMASSLLFRNVHDGLQKYAEETWARDLGEGPKTLLSIPELPGVFRRLHYPTGGEIPPKSPVHYATYNHPVLWRSAIERRVMAREWPTVLTEMRMYDPSALEAIDRVFPDPRGESLIKKVDKFWGFSWPSQPIKEVADHYEQVLRSALSGKGQPRPFHPFDETYGALYPKFVTWEGRR